MQIIQMHNRVFVQKVECATEHKKTCQFFVSETIYTVKGGFYLGMNGAKSYRKSKVFLDKYVYVI